MPHMCTKYEVSMSNPVPAGRCAQTPTPMMQDDAQLTIHDCTRLWLLNQMSQKSHLVHKIPIFGIANSYFLDPSVPACYILSKITVLP